MTFRRRPIASVVLRTVVGILALVVLSMSVKLGEVRASLSNAVMSEYCTWFPIDPNIPDENCVFEVSEQAGVSDGSEETVPGTEAEGIAFPRSFFVVVEINGSQYVGFATYSYSGAWYGTYLWSGENWYGGMAGGTVKIDRLDAILLDQTGTVWTNSFTVDWGTGPIITD